MALADRFFLRNRSSCPMLTFRLCLTSCSSIEFSAPQETCIAFLDMPPFTFHGPVLQTLSPPIPRAAAWASSYPSTRDSPLLNLSQGVPGEAPEQILIDSLVKEAGKEHGKGAREVAGYGNILGEKGLREGVREEMRDIYRWDEDVAGIAKAGQADFASDISGSVAEEGGMSSSAATQPNLTSTASNENGPGTKGVNADNIAITSGCNQAFFITMSAICQAGDEVIIPCPWVS